MSNWQEQQYLDQLKYVLNNGEKCMDRTGTGTRSVFGATMDFDLSKGFPLFTTKTINFSNVVGELLWFLSGKTDLPSLRHYSDKPEGAHTIWSDDYEKFKQSGGKYPLRSYEEESLGSIYGTQWRYWGRQPESCNEEHDQIKQLLTDLKSVVEGDPTKARRLIVQSWNPVDHTVGDKQWAALPACHTDFQLLVRNGKLNLKFNMRSNDLFLGAPYNIASYALLCHIFAKMVGLEVGGLWYTCVDAHIYLNHVEAVTEQLLRKPTKFGKLVLPEFESLEDLLKLTAKDFKIVGYNPQGFIKAPQAS